QFAMKQHFGTFGSIFVTVCIVLFSFSSVLGNFFYIQTGATAIKDSNLSYYIVVFMTLILVSGGSVANLTTIWNLGDFIMGFMALLNIAALFLLYKPVLALLNNYIEQWNSEKIPVYIKGDIPEIEDDAITQWNGEDAHSVRSGK
ncbi:MAG: alanine:cation symporter family protein, partial [Mucispirillum sp.]|nr:alanine:cation symporter family protein [Mucispirillum sp.]